MNLWLRCFSLIFGLVDLLSNVAHCPPPQVVAYMGHIQRNAELAVREMLREFAARKVRSAQADSATHGVLWRKARGA